MAKSDTPWCIAEKAPRKLRSYKLGTDQQEYLKLKDMTAELLKAAKMSALRDNKTMLVFLIDMALLEAEPLEMKARQPIHPAGIPRIPRKAA